MPADPPRFLRLRRSVVSKTVRIFPRSAPGSQGKRYLAEQKRITLRKETNVQPVKKEIHPPSWLLGWMIPVLKMTFWDLLNMQTQDNFLWPTHKWQLQFKTPTNANIPSMNVSEKTKKSRNKVEDFKIDEFVSIKINKVDKTSPLHSNVLLGKVREVDNNYAKM